MNTDGGSRNYGRYGTVRSETDDRRSRSRLIFILFSMALNYEGMTAEETPTSARKLEDATEKVLARLNRKMATLQDIAEEVPYRTGKY